MITQSGQFRRESLPKVFYGEHMKVDSQVRKHFQDNVQPLKDIRDARLRPEAKEDKGKEKGFFKNNFEYDEWSRH